MEADEDASVEGDRADADPPAQAEAALPAEQRVEAPHPAANAAGGPWHAVGPHGRRRRQEDNAAAPGLDAGDAARGHESSGNSHGSGPAPSAPAPAAAAACPDRPGLSCGAGRPAGLDAARLPSNVRAHA